MTTTKNALPEFEDERVQAVYQILVADDEPPAGEHWEGFAARRIVAALASKQAPPDLREIECPPDPDVVDRSLSERPRLSPYDAVARAMDLASLLAGSVGMNNKEQADAYSSRLRRHLIEYVYPATAAEAQDKSEPAASDVARLDFLEQTFREKSAVWLLPCGAGLTFLQIRTFEHEIVNFETVPGGVRAAIDAAIAATQEQKP